MEKKNSTRLDLDNCAKFKYKDILVWFKSLSIYERWNKLIELIIDIKFMEYDESEPSII